MLDFPCKFGVNALQFYQRDGTKTPVPVLTSGHRHRQKEKAVTNRSAPAKLKTAVRRFLV